MLAGEVLLHEQRIHLGLWIHGERDESHLGHLLGP